MGSYSIIDYMELFVNNGIARIVNSPINTLYICGINNDTSISTMNDVHKN